MIREVKREDIPACVNIIKASFKTVADEFGFTEENAPRFTAFATTEERLIWQMDNENRPMYLYEQDGKPCGYYSLLMQENAECELSNLAVLPEYRHCGIGKALLVHAYDIAKRETCKTINIGIVEENVVLRRWYEQNGAVHVGTKKFDFFPFTCGYMKKDLGNASVRKLLGYSNKLLVKDYCDLRTSVGWPSISYDQAQSGLDNSDFIISCADEGKTVGCARLFWDKGYIAYLADVIVKPEYQGLGIGKKMVQECINYIDSQIKEGWRIKIVIVAAKGKEEFYEKFGFKARPNDNYGSGMDMWRE